MEYSLGVAKVDGSLTIIPTRTPSRPSEPPLSKEGWDSARICYSTKGSASRAARNRIKRTATGRYAILMGSFASSIARGVSLLAVLWTGSRNWGLRTLCTAIWGLDGITLGTAKTTGPSKSCSTSPAATPRTGWCFMSRSY